MENQGAGFFYTIKTEEWSFDSLDELVETIKDFTTKIQEL